MCHPIAHLVTQGIITKYEIIQNVGPRVIFLIQKMYMIKPFTCVGMGWATEYENIQVEKFIFYVQSCAICLFYKMSTDTPVLMEYSTCLCVG